MAAECPVSVDELREALSGISYDKSKCAYDASSTECNIGCLCAITTTLIRVVKKSVPGFNTQQVIGIWSPNGLSQLSSGTYAGCGPQHAAVVQGALGVRKHISFRDMSYSCHIVIISR